MSRGSNNKRARSLGSLADVVGAAAEEEQDAGRIGALRAAGLGGAADVRALHELERGLAWASALDRAQILVLLSVSPPLLAFVQRVVRFNIQAVEGAAVGAATAAATVFGAVAGVAGFVSAALSGGDAEGRAVVGAGDEDEDEED